MKALLIAAAHAIPVVLLGLIVPKRAVVNITAIIMCIVAIATGNPRYMVMDLLAVGLAWILMSKDLEDPK